MGIFYLSFSIGGQKIIAIHISCICKIILFYKIFDVKGKGSGILALGIVRVPAPVFPAAFWAVTFRVSYFLIIEDNCCMKGISSDIKDRICLSASFSQMRIAA